MKYFKQNFKRQADQTDIEDSVVIRPAKKTRKGKKRVPKYMRELKRLTVTAKYLKLLRFKSKNSKKTFRVYCYDEDLMGWPYRFTKKINKMASDNDRDSDQQLIQSDKNKCLQSLFEAIEERKKLRQQQTVM